MKATSVFARLSNWLASPEVFGSISKKIPGDWVLYEYYFDEKEELIHKTEDDLKKNSEALQIQFFTEENFRATSKLALPVFNHLKEGNWSIHRNYITLLDSKDFRNNLEFQFAFEKENLKLLRKDKMGNIVFFGFFRAANAAKTKIK